MLVISCHSDTGFSKHALHKLKGDVVEGNLDNFAGVHAVMKAYFSGKLVQPFVRIELTYGEEVDMAGARQVAKGLQPHDTVIVVDVTGTRTRKDISIEKCADQQIQAFLGRSLKGMSYDLYEGCPDPISNMDEVEVYHRVCTHTFFLGIPCQGGDYNAGAVRCHMASIDAVARAIAKIAKDYPLFCRAVSKNAE